MRRPGMWAPPSQAGRFPFCVPPRLRARHSPAHSPQFQPGLSPLGSQQHGGPSSKCGSTRFWQGAGMADAARSSCPPPDRSRNCSRRREAARPRRRPHVCPSLPVQTLHTYLVVTGRAAGWLGWAPARVSSNGWRHVVHGAPRSRRQRQAGDLLPRGLPRESPNFPRSLARAQCALAPTQPCKRPRSTPLPKHTARTFTRLPAADGLP